MLLPAKARFLASLTSLTLPLGDGENCMWRTSPSATAVHARAWWPLRGNAREGQAPELKGCKGLTLVNHCYQNPCFAAAEVTMDDHDQGCAWPETCWDH